MTINFGLNFHNFRCQRSACTTMSLTFRFPDNFAPWQASHRFKISIVKRIFSCHCTILWWFRKLSSWYIPVLLLHFLLRVRNDENESPKTVPQCNSTTLPRNLEVSKRREIWHSASNKTTFWNSCSSERLTPLWIRERFFRFYFSFKKNQSKSRNGRLSSLSKPDNLPCVLSGPWRWQFFVLRLFVEVFRTSQFALKSMQPITVHPILLPVPSVHENKIAHVTVFTWFARWNLAR